jgi:Ser/Thr protein kinase RdoA (MazF antagonist)
MTRAVFAAGGPAPEVLGEVTLEGRFGIVFPRLDGPTLTQLSRTGAMTSEQVGSTLATLALCVHKTPPPADVFSLRDNMEGDLGHSGGLLPELVAASILTLIDRQSPGDGLCHGDLHSGNVIMTAEGPKLIDWTGAVRAPAAFDLACCHVLFSDLAPELVDDPERPRAVGAAVQTEYARLAGMSPAALTAAVEPYLPIVRARVVLGGAAPALRERLIQRVEATLRSEELI